MKYIIMPDIIHVVNKYIDVEDRYAINIRTPKQSFSLIKSKMFISDRVSRAGTRLCVLTGINRSP